MSSINPINPVTAPIDPVALFRLSVLGPLVSREHLDRGELKRRIAELAALDYAIPGSSRCRIGQKTIEAWYYAWRRNGLEALTPKPRADRGSSRIPTDLQEAVLQAKRDNPRRSVRQILRVLRAAGRIGQGELSRSAVHRLLQHHGLSARLSQDSPAQERRSFHAEYAGSIWYGDVMHGPRVSHHGTLRKTYLVSMFDDASRLVAHSAFCLGETALEIEGVLKQALLRRGVPLKIVVDNGPAYRAQSLQGICARLSIQLIFCRPYTPEGKGKLERWHRTVREQFISELDPRHITSLADLNARLWAWIEQVYHRSPHAGLQDMTPLARYQHDLPRIRSLGPQATQLDAVFHHRVTRRVRKDGTVAYLGQRFELPYGLAGQSVQLMVDPHAQRVIGAETPRGEPLGAATALDMLANAHRRRHKPQTEPSVCPTGNGPNLVELALHKHHFGLSDQSCGSHRS